jgi:hypothetical protein
MTEDKNTSLSPRPNRRIPEASALREFFQEQWEYLQRLLEARQINRLKQQEEKEKLSSLVESIVEGTDKRIRGIGSYQKQLRSSARGLLDHIEKLVADMPPAVVVNQAARVNDPLVSTIFVNAMEIQQLFSQNADIQAFFSSAENLESQEVFALLFLNRKDKNILGTEMKGEVILREVKQTSINFYGHQLIGPSVTEEAARAVMKKTLFESVIKHLKKHITQLRYSLSDEQKKAEVYNPGKNINNPEVYLEMLSKQLSLPQELIKLQDNLLRVSKMGIMLPLECNVPSNMLQLYEVEVGGEQSRVVTLVRFSRNELLPLSYGLY